jgi:hypothetical protein
MPPPTQRQLASVCIYSLPGFLFEGAWPHGLMAWVSYGCGFILLTAFAYFFLNKNKNKEVCNLLGFGFPMRVMYSTRISARLAHNHGFTVP